MKESWTYTFNDITTVEWGEDLKSRTVLIPQTGVIKNSLISKLHPDKTVTTIRWNGKCRVEAGDEVFVDLTNGVIAVNIDEEG